MLRPMPARPLGQSASPRCLALLSALACIALVPERSAAALPVEGATAADPARLLGAITARDIATLDRLADDGPPATRALAAVARIHTLDDVAARRAALDAGFVVRWTILEPTPGGPRGLDRISPPLADWIDGRPSDGHRGVLGPIRWRAAGQSTRFGLVDLGALTADVPGHRMARASVRVADGGAAVAWVYSATPWRLWVDGQPAGGGWGEAGLRRAEPVLLNTGPGVHRLLLVVDGQRPAIAVRFARPDGVPLPVEPLDGRMRPHGVSLGPLPGKPTALSDPLGAIEPARLPVEVGPRAGLAQATPDERRRWAGDAPFNGPLWRRIALDGGPAAAEAWARAAALDPLDDEARRRADPHRWPIPARVPEGARTAPPAGADGPLWWAIAEHRVDVEPSAALLEQHLIAVRVRDPQGVPPWPPADADVAACTVLRGPWVRPLVCPKTGDAPVDLQPDDVVVVSWRRARRGAALTLSPPPAPFGRWSVHVEAAVDAPLRIDMPPGTALGGDGPRRIWRLDATTAAEGPVAVGTVLDDAALAHLLDRRLPPVAPARVPDLERRAAVIAGALAASSTVADALPAAKVLSSALARAGEVAEPVFARPHGHAPSALLDPANWPVPLVAVGDRILDPRHPTGARPADLQGAPALRVDQHGATVPLTLPIDSPDVHRLDVRGELRLDDGLLAVTLQRAGRSPLPDLRRLAAPGAVLEATAERLTVRRSDASAFFPLPGFADDRAAGPHSITVDLRVRAPAGSRPPRDVELDSPSGRYRRTSTPEAEGWRTVRTFEWRATGQGAAAFLAAVRMAEKEPLVRGGER